MPTISQYCSTSNIQPDSSLGLQANLGGKSNLIFAAEKVGSLTWGY